MTFHWIALALAICTSLGGQVLLKSGAVGEGDFIAQLFRPTTMVGLMVYGGAALLYIVALRRIPMSVALPCTARVPCPLNLYISITPHIFLRN